MKRIHVCALGLLIVCPALVAASVDGDAEKVKGKWSAKFGPNQDVPITLELKEKELVVEVETGNGEKMTLTGEYTIDEKASPRTMDFLKLKSSNGETNEDVKAIYEFQGETLRICSSAPGEDRPTAFVPIDANGHGTMVFTRVK